MRTASVETEGPEVVSDKALTLAFQAGQDDAYGAIYGRHKVAVESICYRLLRNPQDSQEATQETFLRVYQALPRFNGRYQLGAWISRIATNVCLDRLRERSRRPLYRLPEGLEDFLETAPGDEPEQALLKLHEAEDVGRVLDELAPSHREAILLRDVEGMSYQEISVAMGVTESQVKALLHRARRAFRRAWEAGVALAFFPFESTLRALRRVRRVGEPARDAHLQVVSAGQAMAGPVGSGAQFAATCSAALQQCSAVVAERASAAAAMAAVALAGSLGVSAPEPAVSPLPETAVVKPVEQKQPSDRPMTTVKAHRAEGPATSGKAAIPAPAPAPAEDTAPVAEEAEPGPTPEGGASPPPDASSPPPGEDGNKDPDAGPPPVAEPTGFEFLFTSDIAGPGDGCACSVPTVVRSERVAHSEQGVTLFEHELEAAAGSAGGAAYALDLIQHGSQSAHRMDFSLTTSQGSYRYVAEGAMQTVSPTEWGGWRHVYAGSYRVVSRPGYGEAVPTRGAYQVTVELSSTRVVSMTIELIENPQE